MSTTGFYIYLLLDLSFSIALAIRQLPGSLTEPSRSGAQPAVFVLLALAGMAGTFSNQLPWASDVLLFENGLKFVPDSSNLKDNLANALAARGRSEEAIRLYREVLERDPRFWRSNYNLGHELLKAGKKPGGRRVPDAGSSDRWHGF